MQSFISYPNHSDFSIYNIPFGVAAKNNVHYIVTRIGDVIISLHGCQMAGLFDHTTIRRGIFLARTMNDFIALGKKTTQSIRVAVQNGLSEKGMLAGLYPHNKDIFWAPDDVDMVMPIQIGDYTDFYSSREHATNVGKMFRDPENALLPNWLHLPVGYHGRSSSIVISGTPIRRPKGQIMPLDATQPIYSASKQMDFELEMAFVVGKDTALGQSIGMNEAEDYIFGMVLFNDWSARDIQKWENVPLGLFLGKNFGSTIFPWIVTMEALEPFRVPGPIQEPVPLSYLRGVKDANYDISLEVDIIDNKQNIVNVCQSNFKYMYWSMCQQLAHHTVNGCNVRVGDLMASGTISGPEPHSYGSMLEIAWKGTKPIAMPDGSIRKFIEDNDTVVIRGSAQSGDIRVGFGECIGKVLPALDKEL